MTTRFSVAELAEMLNTTVGNIRQAVTELTEQNTLTKETFMYGGRNWRIAPSDVKKIQEWLHQAQQTGRELQRRPMHRVKSKRVIPVDEETSPS